MCVQRGFVFRAFAWAVLWLSDYPTTSLHCCCNCCRYHRCCRCDGGFDDRVDKVVSVQVVPGWTWPPNADAVSTTTTTASPTITPSAETTGSPTPAPSTHASTAATTTLRAPQECKDAALYCSAMGKQVCTDVSRYPDARKDCPQTCGLCTVPVPTSTTPLPATTTATTAVGQGPGAGACIDDDGADAWLAAYACEALSRYGWCKATAKYHAQTAQRCRLTCGVCGGGDVTTTATAATSVAGGVTTTQPTTTTTPKKDLTCNGKTDHSLCKKWNAEQTKQYCAKSVWNSNLCRAHCAGLSCGGGKSNADVSKGPSPPGANLGKRSTPPSGNPKRTSGYRPTDKPVDLAPWILIALQVCCPVFLFLCCACGDASEPVLHTERLAAKKKPIVYNVNDAMGDSAARDARAERTTAPSARVGDVRTVSNHSYI